MAASVLTTQFNLGVEAAATALEADGANVTRIGIDRLFESLLDEPGRFGLSDAVTPCLFASTDPLIDFAAKARAVSLGEAFACTPAQADARAFFDLVHPNAAVHRAIAGAVDDALAPVPLPGGLPLLLAGLLALGVVRRRA